MGESGQTGGGATSEARQKASEMTEDAREMVSDVTREAQQTASSMIDKQKTRAAESVHSMADILRQTGQQLSEQEQQGMAQYANRAADQIDQLSGYLRRADMQRMRGDLERLSRREPTLFVGGAFAIGLFAARFLKAAPPREPMRDRDMQGEQHQPPGIGRRRAEESLQSQRGRTVGDYETARTRGTAGEEEF